MENYVWLIISIGKGKKMQLVHPLSADLFFSFEIKTVPYHTIFPNKEN